MVEGSVAKETGDGGPGVLGWHHRGPRTASSTTRLPCSKRRQQGLRFKVDLPNYGVFDEKRNFDVGADAGAGELPWRAHRRADLRGHLA